MDPFFGHDFLTSHLVGESKVPSKASLEAWFWRGEGKGGEGTSCVRWGLNFHVFHAGGYTTLCDRVYNVPL